MTRSLAFAVVGLLPAVAPAGVITFQTEKRDPWLTATARPQPSLMFLTAEVDALRDRMSQWNERDFRQLFGEPTKTDRADDVLSVAEPQGVMLSGLTYDGSRRRTGSFRLSDIGRVDVHFGNDGVTPSYITFYLRVTDGFVSVTDAAAVPRRVAWERAAVRKLARHVDDRWRAVVGWEVDLDTARLIAPAAESPDLPAKLAALRQQAGWDRLHENMSIAHFWCYQSEPNSRGRLKALVVYDHDEREGEWYWTDANSRLVSLRTRPTGAGDSPPGYDLEVNTAGTRPAAGGMCSADGSTGRTAA